MNEGDAPRAKSPPEVVGGREVTMFVSSGNDNADRAELGVLCRGGTVAARSMPSGTLRRVSETWPTPLNAQKQLRWLMPGMGQNIGHACTFYIYNQTSLGVRVQLFPL